MVVKETVNPITLEERWPDQAACTRRGHREVIVGMAEEKDCGYAGFAGPDRVTRPEVA